MTIKYENLTTDNGLEFIVRTNEDESISFIPCNEENADYQAYLNKDKPQVEHLTEISTGAKEL